MMTPTLADVTKTIVAMDAMIGRGEVVAAEWAREAGPFAVAKQPPVTDVFYRAICLASRDPRGYFVPARNQVLDLIVLEGRS
jgi:hypothetical protein